VSHFLYLFTVPFFEDYLIKHNTPEQARQMQRLRIDCKSSDGVELKVRNEDGDIGRQLLRRAYEAIIFVFVRDDPSNCKVDGILGDLYQIDLGVGGDFGSQLAQEVCEVELFTLH
jgi:hypothetical protein